MPPIFRFNSTAAVAIPVLTYDMGPGVSVRDFVFHSTIANRADRADATSLPSGQAFGIVRAINTPNLGECQVITVGEVGGFVGLVPGGRYLLGIVPGAIVLSTDIADPDYPDNPGNVILPIGYARAVDTLYVETEDYTIF